MLRRFRLIPIMIFIWKRPWLLIIVAASMFFFAVKGLSTDIRIRSALNSGNNLERTITGKTMERGGRDRWGVDLPDIFYIAWDNIDVTQADGGRGSVPAEIWYNLDIGDTIEVVQLSGRDALYVVGYPRLRASDKAWIVFCIFLGAFLTIVALLRILNPSKADPRRSRQRELR